jgi:hypothetical protein
VILDRGGRVRAYWTGHRSMEGVEEVLRSLLAEPAAPPETLAPLAFRPGALPPVLPRSSASVVTSSLAIPRGAVAPGELVHATLVLEIDPGWSLLAPSDDDGSAFALRLDAAPSGSFDHLSPRPRERELAGRVVSVYSGRVEVPIWGVVPADAPLGRPLRLAAAVTVQACDDASCLLPADIRLDGEVWVDESGESP